MAAVVLVLTGDTAIATFGELDRMRGPPLMDNGGGLELLPNQGGVRRFPCASAFLRNAEAPRHQTILGYVTETCCLFA